MHCIADTGTLLRDAVITPAQAEEIQRRARQSMIALTIGLVLFAGISAITVGAAMVIDSDLLLAGLGLIAAAVGIAALPRVPTLYRMPANVAAMVGTGLAALGLTWTLDWHFGGPTALILIGPAVAAVGAWLRGWADPALRPAGSWIVMVGAALHLFGILGQDAETGLAWLVLHYAAVVVVLTGVLIDVRFVSGLAMLPLAGAFSTETGYSHALYWLSIPEATLTILQMALVAAIALWAARGAERWARHGRVIALLSVIWANMAFWVGSLWGDVVGRTLWGPVYDGDSAAYHAARDAFTETALAFSEAQFAVTWALLIVGTAIWAARTGRRGIMNTAITFGAIHGYTQWFETFGASPEALLGAGAIAIPTAWAVYAWNRRQLPLAVV